MAEPARIVPLPKNPAGGPGPAASPGTASRGTAADRGSAGNPKRATSAGPAASPGPASGHELPRRASADRERARPTPEPRDPRGGRPEAPARPATPEPLWRELLGRRLRAARLRRGETLSRTAGRAGISPQYLSEIERGRKEPSSELIAAVAGALDTTLLTLTEQVAEDLRVQRRAAARGADRAARRPITAAPPVLALAA